MVFFGGCLIKRYGLLPGFRINSHKLIRGVPCSGICNSHSKYAVHEPPDRQVSLMRRFWQAGAFFLSWCKLELLFVAFFMRLFDFSLPFFLPLRASCGWARWLFSHDDDHVKIFP